MRLNLALVIVSAACVAFGGCARTESFNVAVRNDTAEPLTLALTKDGPPYEPTWSSPEELAIESPKADEQHGYVVLPPGREAEVAVTGKFDGGTRGYLRIYRGDLPLSDMSAIGPSSPNRLDLPLRPGTNRFSIGDKLGRLVESRGDAATDAGDPGGPPSTAPAVLELAPPATPATR